MIQVATKSAATSRPASNIAIIAISHLRRRGRAGSLWLIGILASGAVLSLSGGCDREERPIPYRDGPLVLELRFPADDALILRDSTSIWGTVGTGEGRLEVNGRSVRIEPNGTFARLVPLPAGDPVILDFVATRGTDTIRRAVRIVRRAPSGSKASPILEYGHWVRLARLPDETVDSATQARPIFTRWSPGGGLALPIEQGIRLYADRRTEGSYRLRLAPDQFVWAASTEVDTLVGDRPETLVVTAVESVEGDDEATISVALAEPVPSSAESVPGGLVWTLFGTHLGEPAPELAGGDFIRTVATADAGTGRTRFEIALAESPLGWRVEWRDGRLVLRIRTPRPLERGLPGLVVAIDAGHPPGGTIGPGGLREDSMTLAVARIAADRLRDRGAIPVLVRTDDAAVSLDERIVRAVEAGAHIFISIHGNSPGPGRPPDAVDGTLIYWTEPLSFTLGRAMLDAVSASLGVKRIALVREDFAVTRTTWYPAVLVEGTGMVVPGMEARLRTPDGLAAYADGIVNGLETWLAGRTR